LQPSLKWLEFNSLQQRHGKSYSLKIVILDLAGVPSLLMNLRGSKTRSPTRQEQVPSARRGYELMGRLIFYVSDVDRFWAYCVRRGRKTLHGANAISTYQIQMATSCRLHVRSSSRSVGARTHLGRGEACEGTHATLLGAHFVRDGARGM